MFVSFLFSFLVICFSLSWLVIFSFSLFLIILIVVILCLSSEYMFQGVIWHNLILFTNVHPKCGAWPKWICWCIFYFLLFRSWMFARKEWIAARNKKKRFGEYAFSRLMERTVYLASPEGCPTGISNPRSPKLDLHAPAPPYLSHLWWQPRLSGCLDSSLIAFSFTPHIQSIN